MNNKLTKSLWAMVFMLVASAWIFGLFIDLTGDAGLYATIARLMVESGDWLTLKINGVPYDQKPHLFFWLAGAGIKIFGNTNFGFKIFLFLAGASGIYFTYRLGRVIFSEVAGKLAALFAGTSQIFFLYFFDIHTDTVLQAAVILSLWQFAEYLKYHKWLNFIAAFAGTGLAMLTKGPVGAVLPFFFVLFSLMLTKDYRQLLHPKWLAGILLVVLIILPSLLHLWKNFGPDGLWFYFIDNNTGRVSGRVAGSSTDPFFYLYNLLWAFLPWTVPVTAGLVYEFKSWVSKRNVNVFSASLFAGVLIVFVIYSIARGKAPNYMMMLIPPLGVIAAGHAESMLTSGKKNILMLFQFIIIILILLTNLLAWRYVLPDNEPKGIIILIVSFLILSIMFFWIERSVLTFMLFVTILSIAVFNIYLNTTILPSLFRHQGARQVLANYEEYSLAGEDLYVFELEEYALYYYGDDIRKVDDWDHMFRLLEQPGTWIYTNQIKYEDMVNLDYTFEKVYVIEQRGMNRINIDFLLNSTRQSTLEKNYLVKVR